LSFDPAAALLRAVNILDIPHSKRLASGPNYGAIFGQIFFSEALTAIRAADYSPEAGLSTIDFFMGYGQAVGSDQKPIFGIMHKKIKDSICFPLY
jgi:hypothetical protein